MDLPDLPVAHMDLPVSHNRAVDAILDAPGDLPTFGLDVPGDLMGEYAFGLDLPVVPTTRLAALGTAVQEGSM